MVAAPWSMCGRRYEMFPRPENSENSCTIGACQWGCVARGQESRAEEELERRYEREGEREGGGKREAC